MANFGGLSELKPADTEVKNIAVQVRGQAEAKAGKTFEKFEAISYKTQLVEGTNYFIKVHVGGTSYVHLRVYAPLPSTGEPLQLTAIQLNKTLEDEITYFE